MSGNTTRLGVDIAGDPRAAAVPALLIAGFVAGVTGGAVIAAKAGARRKAAVLALVAALLAGAALAGGIGEGAAMLALVVLGMGAINMTFQRGGEVAVGLTYMTGALVKAGQAIGAALLGERRSGWGRHLMLWAALAGGAVGGTLAFAQLGPLALWGAASWTALMAALSLKIPA
jgi:uncharacterized membrane protein YoaK (UPF0700 family)